MLNLIGAATGVTSLVVGGVAAGASVLGVAQGTPHDEATIRCGAVWDRLPEQLQDDLAALRGMSPAERRTAAVKIRGDALAGEYGPRVERFAEHRDELRSKVWQRLPAELRQDVRAARRLAPDEQADAFRDIRDAALAGEYGDRVQEVAERAQARRAACAD